MIALLLCLVSIFTPGLSQTFQLFNSSFALPKPHSSPDLKSQCSVQVVLADVDQRRLTTWSPQKNCKVKNFPSFPTSNNTLIPENIYQCSNGLTIVKSQGKGITQLSAYNPSLKLWETVAVPKVISDVNNYAVTAVPNLPGLFLVGGEVNFNGVQSRDQICALDCLAYVKDGNKDGSAWSCFPSNFKLCSPTYGSCATSSNDFLTVVNGLKAPSVPNNDVGFYPALGKPPTCKPSAVDFGVEGVQDCISPETSQVYAIGTNKFYLMNPEKGSVKLQKGTLPVTSTPARPVRLFFNPETSQINVIGGDEDGAVACYTWFYAKKNWNLGEPFPCKAGRVLGTL